MKPQYYVACQGYSPAEGVPSFSTLTDARKELRDIIREEKAYAKNRGWKRAAVIWHGKNAASIHAMKNTDAPLWGWYSIARA